MIADFQLHQGEIWLSFREPSPLCEKHLARRKDAIRSTKHRAFRLPCDIRVVDEVLRDLVGTDCRATEELAEWMTAERKRLAALDARMPAIFYPFQKEDARSLSGRDKALLASDPGLGKTAQALVALPENAAALVVCPASAKTVWEDETKKWRPDLRPKIFSGQITTLAWPQAGQIAILNYDILPAPLFRARVRGKLLPWSENSLKAAKHRLANEYTPAFLEYLKQREARLAEAAPEAFTEGFDETELTLLHEETPEEPETEEDLLKKNARALPRYLRKVLQADVEVYWPEMSTEGLPGDPIHLIFDEAHATKEPGSLRHASSKLLAREVQKTKGKVWMLTATPMLNAPPEIYALLEVMGTERRVFGPNPWSSFLRGFNAKKKYFGGFEYGKPTPVCKEALAKVILRRAKKDVLPDLPVATFRTIRVPLDVATRRLCDDVEEACRKLGVSWSSLEELVRATQKSPLLLAQISRVRAALAMVKMPAVMDVVQELERVGEPPLVFSAHAKPLDLFGGRKGWGLVRGDVSRKDRDEAVRLFQDGKLAGLALTIQAGGTALTLTRSANVLFVDELWTPELNRQAVDRAVRIGQTRGVLVTKFVADHALDRHLYVLLNAKQELVEATMGGSA